MQLIKLFHFYKHIIVIYIGPRRLSVGYRRKGPTSDTQYEHGSVHIDITICPYMDLMQNTTWYSVSQFVQVARSLDALSVSCATDFTF